MKKTLLFSITYLLTTIMYATAEKKIYILPPGGYENELLFNLSSNRLNRDNCIKHFYDLRTVLKKFGYRLVTARLTDNLGDACMIMTSGTSANVVKKLSQYKNKKLYMHIWEPNCVEPASYLTSNHNIYNAIFIMDDRFVGQNNKYIKLNYPHPYVYMIDDVVPFGAKKFCTLISGNKHSSYRHELYSERERAIRFFENHPNFFEFYGRGWPLRQYKNYKGEVYAKVDTLKKYKYCICYENSSDEPGYITEKIFDCFHAGCVPVYYGAPNVTQYIPENCFIDFRKFDKNYEKLLEYLKSITENQYNEYLNNIRQYLKTAQAQRFSIAYMIHSTLRVMLPEYSASVAFGKETAAFMEFLDRA